MNEIDIIISCVKCGNIEWPCRQQEQFIDYSKAKKLIDKVNADIRYKGLKARYIYPVGSWPNHRDGDYILCPENHIFIDEYEFYFTVFHELMHWTEPRINNKCNISSRELIAELGAFYLCQYTQIPISQDLKTRRFYAKYWKNKKDDFYKEILDFLYKSLNLIIGADLNIGR